MDSEFRLLLLDYVRSGVIPLGSREAQVTLAAAELGLCGLSPTQRAVWESRVLPIVSKPLHEQVAVATILQNGGYVPARIHIPNSGEVPMDREALLKRLERAQEANGNRDHNILQGAAFLDDSELEGRVKEAEEIALETSKAE